MSNHNQHDDQRRRTLENQDAAGQRFERIRQPTTQERIREIGLSTSTATGNRQAVALFDHFIGLSEDRAGSEVDHIVAALQTMEDGTAQGEEILSLFIDFAQFLSRTVLSLTGAHKPLKSTTKVNYFSSMKEIFKAKFSNLDIWKEHDSGAGSLGAWYSTLRSNIEKQGGRTFFEAEDDSDPSRRCRALVVRTSDELLCQRDRIWIQKKRSDLENIARSILLSNDDDSTKYEMRAMLVMLYYAAGRGGEVKFIHWGLVDWDEFFNCPQAWWTRLKTVSKQLLMFQCYRNGWLCDFYHCFGCYFATGGLLRQNTMQGPAKKRIFPSLFTKSNASVARMITDLIKKYCDDDLKIITSS